VPSTTRQQGARGRARSIVGSRQAEQEAWALATTVAAYQQKEVVEVAEDVAR
jgi:hypothetical protein